MSMSAEEQVFYDGLIALGVADKVAKQGATKAKPLSKFILDLVSEYEVKQVSSRAEGLMLHAFATRLFKVEKSGKNNKAHTVYVVEAIRAGKLTNDAQIDAACKYIVKVGKSDAAWDVAAFEKACGVGVTVTQEQIEAAVASLIQKNKATLEELRYHGAVKLLGPLIKSLAWGDGRAIKSTFDAAILALLGPKTEADGKKKKVKGDKSAGMSRIQKKKAETKQGQDEGEEEEEDDFLTGRQIPWCINTPEQKARHLAVTGGTMYTRFPPEPNGYLHTGHVKSMNFNFGVAKKNGGKTYLRFDDTNPEAESKEYIDNIIENVQWLGHQPCKITYSSDYFEQLYQVRVCVCVCVYGCFLC
jgi:glutaminyl-tRNA synthetase